MKKCICKKEMPLLNKIYIHLVWCPESDECKEYNAFSWYKKIVKKNPRNY